MMPRMPCAVNWHRPKPFQITSAARTIVENKVITLTGEVKLTGAVTFESGNWILDLNNYNLDTSKANQIKAVAVAGGELTIRGTGGIIGDGFGANNECG